MPGAPTAKVDAPARMVTGGQVSSLFTGGGAASPTACDFEPNSSLNRLPIGGAGTGIGRAAERAGAAAAREQRARRRKRQRDTQTDRLTGTVVRIISL